MKICILDPGIQDNQGSESMNLGDVIIKQAVTREVMNLLGACDIVRVSTHVPMKKENISEIAGSLIDGNLFQNENCSESRQCRSGKEAIDFRYRIG